MAVRFVDPWDYDLWETVYGRISIIVGRRIDGEISCSVEFDDDELHLADEDITALATEALDAWKRKQEIDNLAEEVGR